MRFQTGLSAMFGVWENALPNGNLIGSLCLRQMRSPLDLDLIDTIFHVKSYPHTVDDHQHYLASLYFKESSASAGIKIQVCVRENLFFFQVEEAVFKHPTSPK